MKVYNFISKLISIAIGIYASYVFIKGMFKQDALSVIFIALIIFVVWCIISFIIKARNKYIIEKNETNEIYVRDIESEYSPAVLSYLMNNKIETSKDLPATLLNLCAKNILKIESVDEKIKIIDLKNKKEVEKLKEDEKYAYKMITKGVSNSKIRIWKNKVEDEYKKYKFSISNKKSLGIYLFYLYVVIFVGTFIYVMIADFNEIVVRLLMRLLIGSIVAAFEMVLFTEVKEMLSGIIIRKNKNEFREIYTSKGAREYSKWKKFEKFIEDFSLMKEREHESIVIWGKYLSYSIALGINKKCDKELYNKIKKEYLFDFNLFSQMYDYEEE